MTFNPENLKHFRKSGRSLAVALAFALLCPPVASLLPRAEAQDNSASSSANRFPTIPQQAGPIGTILLFPFANGIGSTADAAGFNPEITGARLEDAVKMRLNVIGRYKANSFSPSLPQIQRAIGEARVEGLTENDVLPPYNDVTKGAKIATEVGTDGFLLGKIESISSDPVSRNVTVTVYAALYNSSTGETVKGFGVTGHGISYNVSDSPDNLLQSAINDVAGHIVSGLNADVDKHSQVLPTVDYVRGHKSNGGSILLGILLATGIGFAIASTHHSSSGGGSTSSGGSTGTGTGVPNPPVLSGGSDSSPPAAPNP